MFKVFYRIIVLSILLTATIFAEYSLERVPWNNKVKVTGSRQSFILNSHWKYLEMNTPSVKELPKNDVLWTDISLPHTWNAFDVTDNNPGYRRDASWYKTEIKIPKSKLKNRWILYFEGANISTEVYVNSKRAGAHVGGYIGFEIDITDFVKTGKKNEILIRVDNAINPNIIPSQKSDFFIFGGITRDLWLLNVPQTFIKDIQASTPKVNLDEASTKVQVDIQNEAHQQIASITLNLEDNNNKFVSKSVFKETLKKGLNSFEFELQDVANPELWSPDSPSLYTLTATLNTDKISDSFKEKIGYRWFEFQEHGPFLLNGERLLLKGTHRHEEWAGLGAAMLDDLHRRDIEMIKEMGANFVRLAHYPQDPEIYRACDELGLLVWDELPWCRGGMGGKEWKANTTRLFEEQILQNINHPSIILWSVGNELYWIPDFPNGDNRDSLNAMVTLLNNQAHSLDPYRLTTMRKYYDGADITDVFSPSIWAGWYSGVYKTYEKALVKARKKYKKLFHAEYGGSSHVGRHNENPITGEGMVNENEWDEKPNMINVKKISSEGDWSENYIVDLFDWHLMTLEKLDWFPGAAQWAFKDFGTPLRPENAIPYMNQKGLVDRNGNPKDAYYVFKSYWTTDPLFCYIESHTWTDRFGKAGELKEVCVYSNAEEVDFILNGKSQGKKTRNSSLFPAAGLNWNVLFQKGENIIEAVAYKDGEIVSRDNMTMIYHTEQPGKPDHIALSSEKLENGHVLVRAQVVDKKGTLCYTFNKRVYFDLNGGGRLMKYYGTPTGSDVIEFASGKAAIEVIPEPGKKAVFEARTQDFKGDYLILDWTK